MQVLLFTIESIFKEYHLKRITDMKTDEQNPLPDNLYSLIKGHFVMQDDTVTEWCKRNGTYVANLKYAISGSWKGPKATALVQKAIKDCGLKLEDAA
jgi:hypothetical protein